MDRREEHRIQCPYCGAGFTILLEALTEPQHYVEDCRSCCYPIDLTVWFDPHAEHWQVATGKNSG